MTGLHIAEMMVKGAQLDLMRVMHNSYNCQQPIVIQPPTPGSVHVGPSSGGGGVSHSCWTVTEWREISYDGGMTWIPFPIEESVCVSES